MYFIWQINNAPRVETIPFFETGGLQLLSRRVHQLSPPEMAFAVPYPPVLGKDTNGFLLTNSQLFSMHVWQQRLCQLVKQTGTKALSNPYLRSCCTADWQQDGKNWDNWQRAQAQPHCVSHKSRPHWHSMLFNIQKPSQRVWMRYASQKSTLYT